MRVSIVGTGYVGLVSGACLAHLGHDVVCVDVDPRKVDMIASKKPPIYEKGLQELLDANVPSRLTATTDLRKAVLESDLSLIAVGTPFDGQLIDLKYIRQVAQEIGAALKDKPGYHMVVVKSTVVPGTTTDVVLPILEKASGKTRNSCAKAKRSKISWCRTGLCSAALMRARSIRSENSMRYSKIRMLCAPIRAQRR
jgi:UDPglucose 6-dehydrogenase